jgi:hypothetical protein
MFSLDARELVALTSSADEVPVLPLARNLVFRRCPMPRPSYWEGALALSDLHHDVAVTIEAGADGPHREQMQIIEEVSARYICFLSAALVRLKPAFNRYIGDQRKLQTMDLEFTPVHILIRPFPALDWRLVGLWHMSFRSVSRRELLFAVGFVGERATSLSVDRD